MKMYQDERRFDFHGLGLALKQAREAKGWTQAYVAELVGKTDKTIMNIENKGQHPSFNLFFKLVTLFDISVDQFFYTEGNRGGDSCRKHIDVLLDSMNEKELVVMEATAYYFFLFKNTRNHKRTEKPQAGKSPTCGLAAAKLLCRNFPFSQIELTQRINFRGGCLKAKRDVSVAIDALQDTLDSAAIMAQQHSDLNFCTMLVVVSQPHYLPPTAALS